MAMDFDAWSTLARISPEEFERERRHAVENVIAEAANARLMRGLQWRIDAERHRAHTPLKACLRLSALMWDTFFDLKEALNGPVAPAPCPLGKTGAQPPASGARIIPLCRQGRLISAPSPKQGEGWDGDGDGDG